MKKLKEVYGDEIVGSISGWDRIRFRGTIRWLANKSGMASFMSSHGILLKDFAAWAERITKTVRKTCAEQAERMDIPMLYLRSSGIDKEAMARQIMKERGIDIGDICMFSVVESCRAPLVRGNRSTKRLELEMGQRKCVWIYHYWDDPVIGFGHTRLQTWLPLSVTICINGRHWLERQLIQEGIEYIKAGNCFPYVADIQRAQECMDAQLKTNWSQLLQGLLKRNCSDIPERLGSESLNYYWSADETEWATDVMFRSTEFLDTIFPSLLRYGLISAQSPTIMRFFGKNVRDGKFYGHAPDEIITDLRKRYEGMRLKHWINNNSIKMYNKAGSILRIETTINSTREFKVFRCPNDDSSRPASWQRMRKGVSDLHRRAQLSQGCNERYGEHLAAASIKETLLQSSKDICARTVKNGRPHRAINPWQKEDFDTLQFLTRGEYTIRGFRNRDLRQWLYTDIDVADPATVRRFSGRVTRRIQLFRAHGLIKKIPRTTRYSLTAKGRKVATSILAASSTDTERLMEMAA
jgi:hypothetical protein